jgi:CheY-like chemotaxis protein
MNRLALVVEDDAGTRKLLGVLLARIGFSADVVATGADALLLLEHVDYDVIFVDLLLGGVSGTEIVEWVARERPEALRRVVVLSSASPNEVQSVRDTWPEVRAFRKPFELSEVLDAAGAAANEHPPRHELTFAEQFVRESVRAGAKAGLVVRVDGPSLQPVLDFGYARGVVPSFFPMAIDAPLPICAAVRHARPVWLASLQSVAIEYPTFASVVQQNETRALGVVPLSRDGRVIGAAGWAFRVPRLFTELEQETFGAIAASLLPSFPGEDQHSADRAHA